MPKFPAPAPKYQGPPFRWSSGSNKPIDRIVIHSTVSPCVRGGARQIADYFRSSRAGGSAHYVIDPGEVIQSAYDSVIAWHAPPNPGSLGLEMCDIPGPVPDDSPMSAAFKAARRVWRWRRPEQKEMLARTARLTAELCLAFDVPAVFLGPTALRAGRRGITTHNFVSTAFRQSTHWDPGFWPRRRFMGMVRREIADIKAAAEPKPDPKPQPKPEPKPEPLPKGALTIGTHNLHDDAGTPTFFADVLFFTEAIAPTVRARAKAVAARTKAQLDGYKIVRARENRTVLVALRRDLVKVTGVEWHRAHDGIKTLTPARGTLLVRGELLKTGEPASFLAEHRINDSWKTGARQLAFRKECWRKHTDLTKSLAEREIAAGRRVFAGGDPNTVKSMSAYEGVLKEAGKGLDRLGVSPDMTITEAEVLSRRGSDHPRIRAIATKESR